MNQPAVVPIAGHKAAESRIVFLDYLRIFAFVSVLIGHKFHDVLLAFSENPAVHATPRFMAKLLLPFVYGGGAGVVVFFLVSGYIITHVLQAEKPWEFLLKRAFRIYPLYMSAVFIQHVMKLASGDAVDISVLFPQLLLVGDFFETPYALNGVEWTLRMEVLFYSFMFVLRVLNLGQKDSRALPYVLIVAVLACSRMAPIPSADGPFKGYLTIYGPFLLLGCMFYLFEKKAVRPVLFAFFTGLVLWRYYRLIAAYQSGWLEAHFATLAVGMFLVFWLVRKSLSAPAWVLLLSDMTFAVYLFHNWLFDYALRALDRLNVALFHPRIQAVVLLMLFCYAMVTLVEKPGIIAGRRLLARLRRSPKPS